MKAVANVNDIIAPQLIGLDPGRQSEIDRLMIELDGTPNKGKLGANARLYQDWIGKFPIVSIEDGLAENDWESFKAHTAALGDQIQIVGDDIYVTNTRFIGRGI